MNARPSLGVTFLTSLPASSFRAQVAELVATCCAEPQLALNKCLEVQATTEAPKKDIEELLAEISSELSLVRAGFANRAGDSTCKCTCYSV